MLIKNTPILIFFIVLISVCSFGSIDEGQTPDVSTVCQAPAPNDGVGQSRAKYVCEIEVYLPLVQAALQETKTPQQEQAKILNNLRRTIGQKYKNLTPEWLRSFIYCRNVQKYGDYLGPTYEKLSAQGKEDAQIIKSATRTGGKDLFLDSKVGLAVIDFVNYLNWGPAIDQAWSWIPGKACPIPVEL